MKKNILLVHSFLVLPLLTSSFTFSSEKITYAATVKGTQLPPKKQTSLNTSGSQKKNRKERKKEQQPAPQVAQKTVVEDSVETPIPSVEQFDAVISATPVILNEQTVEQVIKTTLAIDLPMPEKIIIDKTVEATESIQQTAEAKPSVVPAENIVRERMAKVFAAIQEIGVKASENVKESVASLDPLAASVYQPTPTIKQGLTWKEWAKSKISSTWLAIDAIKDKSFDPENADHMSSLNTAAEKLVLTGNSAELQDLLQACRRNYPNIKLDKSVALQIKKRFQLDECTTKTEYADQITLENTKLKQTQEAIFAQNALFIQKVAAELDNSNIELAKAQIAYMTATNDIIAKQNKRLADTRQATMNLSKLYRKLPAIKDEAASEHLSVLKLTHATQENIYRDMGTLDNVHATLQGTLSLITPVKTTTLQLTDK